MNLDELTKGAKCLSKEDYEIIETFQFYITALRYALTINDFEAAEFSCRKLKEIYPEFKEATK